MQRHCVSRRHHHRISTSFSQCPSVQETRSTHGHGSEVIKCLLSEVYEAVSKCPRRKRQNSYIYRSCIQYTSSIYIKDNPLRVKVRESLGHLGQWRRKVLIINELSASKKCPRRGFASWTSWTPAILGTRTGLPQAPRTPWTHRHQPLEPLHHLREKRHALSFLSPLEMSQSLP